MIGIHNLEFSYPDNTSVFSGFSWNAGYGESWSVPGLSGSGKTTLLFLISGLIKANGGELLIAGHKIIRPRPATGFIIVRAYQSLRYKEMYAGILAISLLGFLLYYLIDILEWRVSRHKPETEG